MLEVQRLSIDYRSVKALDNIDLRLNWGELVGLIGPNGAGKSTLLQAILGLVPITQGRILLDGESLQQQRQRIAYVPQRSHIDWDYPITAWQVVMMARQMRRGWWQRPSRQSRQQVDAALERVGMLHLGQRQIGELSGGQQQRIFLARAIAQEADLLLLDEPLTGVDKQTEQIVLDIFTALKEEGKTILVSSHEWGQALNRYDRLLLLNQTLLANDTPQRVMTFDNIQRAFGQSLPIQPNLSARTEMPLFC
jgi:manganese/iron transport system ATP-binding protein